MILRGDAGDGSVARSAAAIGWTLPEVLVVAVVPAPHVDGLRAALGRDALVAERGTDGRRADALRQPRASDAGTSSGPCTTARRSSARLARGSRRPSRSTSR